MLSFVPYGPVWPCSLQGRSRTAILDIPPRHFPAPAPSRRLRAVSRLISASSRSPNSRAEVRSAASARSKRAFDRLGHNQHSDRVRSGMIIANQQSTDGYLQGSSDHTQIVRRVRDLGDLVLVDLGSTNGTFVNDEPVVTPARVRPGDRVLVGAVSVAIEVLAA
jgi:hypothetical protein